MTPNNLDEAVEYLVKENNFQINDILFLTEEEFIGEAHHSLGRKLRNEWGLWFNETEIGKWFEKLGVYHADDRSSIILTSFYRYIRGEEYNLEEQMKNLTEWN